MDRNDALLTNPTLVLIWLVASIFLGWAASDMAKRYAPSTPLSDRDSFLLSVTVATALFLMVLFSPALAWLMSSLSHQ